MADLTKVSLSPTRSILPQLLAGLVAVSGAISSGIILGFSAVSLPQLTNEGNAGSQKVYLTSEQASWFASLPAIVAPIGCLLCGPLLDRFGRKLCLFLVNGPAFLGWILLATVTLQTGSATEPATTGPATVAQMYTGRVFSGLAVGMASIPGTVYLAEIASSNVLRSMLVTWTSLGISFGILLVYILGAVPLMRSNWQLIAAVCAVLPLVASVTTWFVLPESPVWLLSRSRDQEAWRALRTLRGLPAVCKEADTPTSTSTSTSTSAAIDSVRAEFYALKTLHANVLNTNAPNTNVPNTNEPNTNEPNTNIPNMSVPRLGATPNGKEEDCLDTLEKPATNETAGKEGNGSSQLWSTAASSNGTSNDRSPIARPIDKTGSFLKVARTTIKQLLQPEVIKPLAIMFGMFFFQQFSGIYVVIFYAVDILVAAGVTLDPYLATVLLGAVQFVAGIAVSFALRRCGRRPMSLVSGLGMTLSLIGLALYEQLEGDFSWFPLVAMLAFVIFGMIGFHTIPWALLGEMYPLHVKGIAAGITTCVGYVFSFVALKIYPQLFAITNSQLGIFYFYALMSLLATLFVAIFLPETHRKTLAEIQEEFRKKTKKTTIEREGR